VRALIVDDEPLARRGVVLRLKKFRDVEVVGECGDGASAVEKILELTPDVVFLDVQMPGMDGYEVCQRIRANSRFRLLPVVMITARSHTEDRVKALERGADDFMTKPFERAELVARVRSSLRLKSLYNTLNSAEQVIFALAAAVEAKDSVTERHTRRVAESARHIGERLGLPDLALDALYRGGIVHDIGKIGVSEAILLKCGPLDTGETERMQEHPEIGANIIAPLHTGLSLQPIIRHHHERFDGCGYPDGLRGDEIPLLARIISICDAFDALINDRPYRAGVSVDQAIATLRSGAGTQWDPELVELFVVEMPYIGHLGAA
jgi:putative two-component system response regulator